MKNYAIITTSFMVSVFTLPNAYGLQHNTYDECSDHWDKKYYTTHNKYNNLTISSKHSCTLLSSLGTYRECIFYWKF